MGKRGKTSPVPDRFPMVSRNSLSAARKVLRLAAISLLEKWDEVSSVKARPPKKAEKQRWKKRRS
jgi:hypothetical protein